LRVGFVVLRETLEQADRRAIGRAVLQRHDREPADGLVAVGGRKVVEQAPHAVDRGGMVAREELDREQRGTTRGRALVVQASTQQLFLRAPAELADRAKRERALTEVGAAR